ncbi:cytochrome C [Spongiivirga sp. MCCC 1A20706]|uniref:cytochrome C n=1 Tax=Spongiivirga sp. MCCC 1A20706 TaxID=3160963 RepID=UPI00397767EC
MKKRLGIISFFILILAGFIFNWNYSYQKGLEEAYIPLIETPSGNYLSSERGVFKQATFEFNYTDMPVDSAYERTIKDYYKNRAYLGAPPSIPHPLIKGERGIGGNSCLQCHQNGGFVDAFKAYAPVTPHPEMVNCRQCHVAQNSTSVFKQASLEKIHPPSIGTGANNALFGSPPMIPHGLQMRENCIACHAGPGAVKELRVSHPERINCRQCHLPKQMTTTIIDTTKFLRQFDKLNE